MTASREPSNQSFEFDREATVCFASRRFFLMVSCAIDLRKSIFRTPAVLRSRIASRALAPRPRRADLPPSHSDCSALANPRSACDGWGRNARTAQKLYIEDRCAIPKILWSRLTNKRERPSRIFSSGGFGNSKGTLVILATLHRFLMWICRIAKARWQFCLADWPLVIIGGCDVSPLDDFVRNAGLPRPRFGI